MNAPLQTNYVHRQPGDGDDENADLFDYQLIKNWAGFVFNAFGRHRILGITCFLVVLAVAIASAMFLPRKYVASTKILTKQNNIISALSNPYRGLADEGPTRAAYETVVSRANLQKIVTQTGLVQSWQDSRNPLLRMKDQVVQMIVGKWSDDDWTDMMVGTLEQRLGVTTGEGVVEISITWPDAQMARRLVEAAQQNFLETRHVSEVAAISETIGILELHASQTQQAIDEALTNVSKVVDERQKGIRSTSAPPIPKPKPVQSERQREPAAGDATAQELTQLRFLLRTKQRAISDLQEFRQRQLTELRTQLEQQRVIYNRNHPVIQELEQRIATLGKDSPQLLTLKGDEQDLIREIESKGGGRDANEVSPVPRRPVSSGLDTALSPIAPGLTDDPSVIVAQDQLRVALARQQDLLIRVEAAKLELDSARAAFKYRFSVVNPAQTPRKPVSPNVPVLIIAGLVGGIILAFFVSAALDLWRRSVVESWQVERSLGLPVLASIKTNT